MGTNYYVVMDRCDCCGRGERFHLCKSFRGFQGFRDGEGPGGAEVRSWRDWKRILGLPGVVVEDEYGVVVPVAEVVAQAEAVPAGRRDEFWRSQRAAEVAVGYDDSWRDGDGFMFTMAEFF